MTVPKVPFWCSAANVEFQNSAAGWLKTCGPKAQIGDKFWASQLAGRAAILPISSAGFSVSAWTQGQPAGGYAAPGRPGYTETGHRVDHCPIVRGYRASNYGDLRYQSNRDMAFFGYGVTELHLAAAGISKSEAIGSNRRLHLAMSGGVDHDIVIGYMQFHMNTPWRYSVVTVRSHIYGANGRQSFSLSGEMGVTPNYHIRVPFIYTRQGEHSITTRVSTI